MCTSPAKASMANAETTLQQQIRLAVGTNPEARIFRNQVGSLPRSPHRSARHLRPCPWIR
jgi:hypothetical protein